MLAALLRSPCRSLCHHRRSDLGILVADELAYVETVALFASADEFAFVLAALHHLGYVLEAGKDIVDRDCETLADLADKFGGDDGLHHILPRFQETELLAAVEDVVCHQRSCLITVEEHHLSLLVSYGYTHSVCIRIGSDNDIRSRLVGLGDSHLEG